MSKIIVSPMLSSITWSRDHRYSKSLSQTTIVGGHRGADMKIHTSRSMPPWSTHLVGGDTLTIATTPTLNHCHKPRQWAPTVGPTWRYIRQDRWPPRSTHLVGSDTLIIAGGTRTVTSVTRTDVGSTRSVDGSTWRSLVTPRRSLAAPVWSTVAP
jgi:hypothetical protein